MNKWWKDRVVYQIYPISFCDSNGDGFGDIKGIISKIDYLIDLGVGAIWLNPIYDSPNDDMGYDIRDYRKVQNMFGSIEDLKLLIHELHKVDIKLIMDLVVNHTSDEHKWFVESSKSKENPFHDYYIWVDGIAEERPNSLASFFTPSAWTYNNEIKQWYLHLFSEKQPDLNWENEKVRDQVYSIINFWFDLGIDGFRMDVINLIAKNLKFDSISIDSDTKFDEKQFANQPKLHTYLEELRERCFYGRDNYCVGETPFANEDDIKKLVLSKKELDMIFQFDFLEADTGIKKWDYQELDLIKFKETLSKWQNILAEKNSVFWSNHDQSRPVSRYGNISNKVFWEKSSKMLAVAMHFLRGTSYIFQGEELGMTNYLTMTKDDLFDIESIEYYKTLKTDDEKEKGLKAILKRGRENARSPIHWTSGLNAGFTTAVPWARVNNNYLDINAQDQLLNDGSVLSFYKKIIYLKSNDSLLIDGEFELLRAKDKKVFAYSRTLGNTQYLIYCNFTNENLLLKDEEIKNCELILSNYNELSWALRPYESLVLKKVLF